MNLIFSLAVSLLLTIGLELCFSLLWGVRGRGLLLVLLMNLMTNPAAVLLHFTFVRLLGWSAICVVPLLELAAVIAEGFCCRGIIRRPWLFALLVNLFSYGMGELLQWLV